MSPRSLIYRLYHDEQGQPLFYSMEHHDGIKYIDITPQQFSASNSHVRVVNGVLVERKFRRPQLRPHSQFGTCCHPANVALIQPPGLPGKLWNLTEHDQY